MSYQNVSVDLHIHSALSPCADESMTPGNIVGMAKLNGLSAIAVTDHNASQNSEAAVILGKRFGITVIPGMELETAEEIHVVCLFPDLERLACFQERVTASYNGAIPPNRAEIFGRQFLYNAEDEICGELAHMLLAPTGITIDDSFEIAASLGGIAYPAHVDRDSYSVLTNLGALPYGYANPFVEISSGCDRDILLQNYPLLENYKLLPSSDAHYLDKIQEDGRALLAVEETTAGGILDALKEGRIL
ncbi:MAG: PHP domain-containing protein [Clostridia bacterium]